MDQGCMNGAPFKVNYLVIYFNIYYKMDLVCNYYYGELITTL
jgi:hypothetical protein